MIICRTAILVLLLTLASNNLVAQSGLSLRSKVGSVIQQGWAHTLLIMFVGGVTLCGVSGCERSEPTIKSVVSVLQADGGAVITKDVTVTVGDDIYNGVIGIAENGLILAEIDDEGLTLVFLEHSDDFVGFAVPEHSNLGRKAYVLTTQVDGRVTRREGTVIEVFDNGYLQIEIENEFYLDDSTPVSPFTATQVIAYELLLLKNEQGGFID